jgi:hypothetical protein
MIYKGYRVNEPLKPADIFVCNCKYGHYNCECDGKGGKRMNDFEKFKATLEIMEFHLNEDRIGETIISRWVGELNQILQMYHDMANVNAGKVLQKTKIQDDPYYGREGPK